jgi:hypothetical protein
MKSSVDILGQVQQSVWRRNTEQPRAGHHEYIAVSPDPQGVSVDFWGEVHEDSYAELLQALTTPAVAAELRSLTLRGPDEGANGTRNWDLRLLVGNGVQFPKLEAVAIQQTAPSDHNRTIVGGEYAEDGVLARLLAAAPAAQPGLTVSAERRLLCRRPARHGAGSARGVSSERCRSAAPQNTCRRDARAHRCPR